MEALSRLHLTVSRAYRVNPEINFEVFIHKVDGLSDDHKIETQRDIHQRANDDLADASLEKLHLRYILRLFLIQFLFCLTVTYLLKGAALHIKLMHLKTKWVSGRYERIFFFWGKVVENASNSYSHTCEREKENTDQKLTNTEHNVCVRIFMFPHLSCNPVSQLNSWYFVVCILRMSLWESL